MSQSEITFSKGSITVTVYADDINDNFNKKIVIIPPAQSANNQSVGPKSPKIVDLLRVTHQIVISAHIAPTASKTATQIKQDLVNIWKGAGQDGGTVTLTYDGNASAVGNTSATATTTINGYIEKVNFAERSMGEPDDFQSSPSKYQNDAKYEVAITFVEGIKI